MSETGINEDTSIWLYLNLSDALFFLEKQMIPAEQGEYYKNQTHKGLPPTSSLGGIKSETLEVIISKSILTEFYVQDGESRAMWERRRADGIALNTTIGTLEKGLREDRFTTAIVPVSNERKISNINISRSTGERSAITVSDIWPYFGYKDNSYDQETPIRLVGIRNSLSKEGKIRFRKLPVSHLRKNEGFKIDRNSVFNEIVIGPQADSWLTGLFKEYVTENFSVDGSIRKSAFNDR